MSLKDLRKEKNKCKKVYLADKTDKTAKKNFQDARAAFRAGKKAKDTAKKAKDIAKKAKKSKDNVKNHKDNVKKSKDAAKKAKDSDEQTPDKVEKISAQQKVQDLKNAYKDIKNIYFSDDTNESAKKEFRKAKLAYRTAKKALEKAESKKRPADEVVEPSTEKKKKQKLTKTEKSLQMNPPSTRLFIGNLMYTVTTEKVRKFFKPAGEVTDIVFILDKKTQEPRGMGFVTFATQEEADKALEMSDKYFWGRPIMIKYSKERSVKKSAGPPSRKKVPGMISVFVGNLPQEVENIKLQEFFKDCGEINTIRYVTDRVTGVFKGVAFVEFRDPSQSLDLAVAKHGEMFLGRAIRVNYGKPSRYY